MIWQVQNKCCKKTGKYFKAIDRIVMFEKKTDRIYSKLIFPQQILTK